MGNGLILVATALQLAIIGACTCAALASPSSYTVGGSKGWATGVNYAGWASGKTFTVGDTLVFKYVSKEHTVTEVNKIVYDDCSGSSVLSDADESPTNVTLATPGTHYFICKVPGHCSGGMKLAVTVAAVPEHSGSAVARSVLVLLPALQSAVALIKLLALKIL